MSPQPAPELDQLADRYLASLIHADDGTFHNRLRRGAAACHACC
jgi:hypothetical protein